MSRDSEVGIVTGYGLDGREVGLMSPDRGKTSSGALSPGLKRPGRETDHTTPSSAEVKNTWIYTSTPSYVSTA
jgi:hypothetical protein